MKKVIAKINKFPKLFLFFGTFQGKIDEKTNNTIIQSDITNKKLLLNEIPKNFKNKIKFVLLKVVIGITIFLLSIYNFYNLKFNLFNILILLAVWIFAIFLSSSKKRLNEDLILLFFYLITLIIIFSIKKTIISSSFYYATDTLCYIGATFLSKAIKEYLYENEKIYITPDKNFIVKIKTIKE